MNSLKGTLGFALSSSKKKSFSHLWCLWKPHVNSNLLYQTQLVKYKFLTHYYSVFYFNQQYKQNVSFMQIYTSFIQIFRRFSAYRLFSGIYFNYKTTVKTTAYTYWKRKIKELNVGILVTFSLFSEKHVFWTTVRSFIFYGMFRRLLRHH